MIKEFMIIKREQLRLQHKESVLLQSIRFELKEIKAFMELMFGIVNNKRRKR